MSSTAKKCAAKSALDASAIRIRKTAAIALRAGNKYADAYHQSRRDNSNAVHAQLAAEYDAKASRTKSAGWHTRYAALAKRYRSYIGVHIDERCYWAHPSANNALRFQDPSGVGTYDHVTFNAFDSASYRPSQARVCGETTSRGSTASMRRWFWIEGESLPSF